MAGIIADLFSFNFETNKQLSTGENGMVITKSKKLATNVRKFGRLGYKTLSAGVGMRTVLPQDFQIGQIRM